MDIQDYNKLIAELILRGYRHMIDKENEIIRGGGTFTPSQMPLPQMNSEPYMGIDPEGFRKMHGGRMKVGQVVKTTGAIIGNTTQQVTKGMQNATNATGKVIMPIAQKAGEKVLNKTADALADKAIESIVNSMENQQANEVGEGLNLNPFTSDKKAKTFKVGGSVKRAVGRPKKEVKGGREHGNSFIKAIQHVGSQVANAVVNKGINKGIDAGIKYMSNPEVEQTMMEVAESGAEAGAGLKKRRNPSQRNLLIGQLMKKGYSMKEANQILKQKMK